MNFLVVKNGLERKTAYVDVVVRYLCMDCAYVYKMYTWNICMRIYVRVRVCGMRFSSDWSFTENSHRESLIWCTQRPRRRRWWCFSNLFKNFSQYILCFFPRFVFLIFNLPPPFLSPSISASPVLRILCKIDFFPTHNMCTVLYYAMLYIHDTESYIKYILYFFFHFE